MSGLIKLAPMRRQEHAETIVSKLIPALKKVALYIPETLEIRQEY
jgi:hypothetical protein